MVLPRVLVGCPTADSHDYCLKEYADAVKSLSYPNYDILLVDNSEGNEYFEKIKSFGIPVIKDDVKGTVRDKIIHGRNLLRQKALDEGYDYFLSLEQDVIPPKNVIEQLIKADKKIITGVYFGRLIDEKGNADIFPLLWVESKTSPNEMARVRMDVLEKGKIIEVNNCGLGCLLIHRSVLERIMFRYDKESAAVDDVAFCEDAHKMGLKVFCDAAIKCNHLITKRPWTWPSLLKSEAKLMTKINPRILVGCPTAVSHEYCLKEYAESVKSLSYPNYDILLVDNSEGDEYFEKIKSFGLNAVKGEHLKDVRERIAESRNILRQKVLDEGYEYLLSLEQDVIPPKNVIEKLLYYSKSIVTGLYYNYFVRNGKKRLAPLLWVRSLSNPAEMVRVRGDVIEQGGIVKVDFCGLGCILIHRSILEKIKFRVKEDEEGMDDVFFCTDVKNEGFSIYADVSVKCNHIVSKRSWEWSDLIDFSKFKKKEG